MADDPFSLTPLFSAWVRAQTQIFEAQEPFWKQISGLAGTAGAHDLTGSAEAIWDQARQQSQDWIATFGQQMAAPGAGEGIAQETLQKMMDPRQFLYAGSDEINQTIQKLVAGPEFADIGMLERQGLKATSEWVALREASAEYRMVTGQAWTRAFERFSRDMLANPELWKKGPRAVTENWLEISNDELIASQRTSDFLNAQRKLLRAGVDYRLRERAMVEVWCETHSIPTRTEIDDLHKTVYALRRDARRMKKELEAMKQPARKAAVKTPAPTRKD
ncbi:MAG: hypothetical protein ACI8R4_001202 [Paracoccaceae bacterium]|jgi:hypothetical protein